MRKKFIFAALALACFLSSCREQQIDVYDASSSSLNIAKGEFRPNEYPESYSFNAYFLGVGAGDYVLRIPVRLTGLVDYDNDREYRVGVDPSFSENAVNGEEFTMNTSQIFRKGLYEDSITVTIHVAALNEVDNYKIRVVLVPNDNFIAGLPSYQYVDISFVKNVNTAPAFWTGNSKLKKFAYHPAKCAKFLEVSGITDPEWVDSNNSFLLEYWINTCIQWFEDNEVIDQTTGNRIYFDGTTI